MAAKYVSINNQLFLEEDAKIGVADLAMHRGYGIFDYLKVIDNRPIFIEDHLDRFFNSAKEMYLEVEPDREQLKKTILELIEKNGIATCGVKLLLTGGYSTDGYAMGKPNLIISQYPLNMEQENEFDMGMKLVTYDHQRQLPFIKTIDYLMAVRLQPFMKQKNADDVLYHNTGVITECPRANFFVVTEKEIWTPAHNILKGITRSKVLKFRISGYPIVEKDFSIDDFKNVREAFITSTTKYAYPVSSIDGRMIGNGKIGPVTRQVRDLLFKLTYAK
ncbi:aminotransferase class IV [Mucilaginibacter sp. BJC16-A38]|uniref:aminotransferase class IV n=1 Tax=Mucilaginibacter phenanthrenivorans TaxID=1234842 RepID=UPI0021573B68|nr:aminotransferase class IV [Mucilaginibacter phenanthrenivorans]MCR8559512.1 aminotransferase class IV [Mucilaginibacter phenanthrenivorans]